MKRALSLACLLLISANASLYAATPAPTKPQTTQQQRMAECSAQNKGKKGDEYKAAQSACLSGHVPAASTPQERMKSCNADAAAKHLKGDERKSFMSQCLKAHA